MFVTHDVDEAVRLGDRIAVLSEGGTLEQYDPPAELLAKPANDFVAEFVGADRGIKRLAVTPLPADAVAGAAGGVEPGPVGGPRRYAARGARGAARGRHRLGGGPRPRWGGAGRPHAGRYRDRIGQIAAVNVILVIRARPTSRT